MLADCEASKFYYDNQASEPQKGTYKRKNANQYATIFTFNDRSKVVCYRDGSMAWAAVNGIYLAVKTAHIANCKPGQIIETLTDGIFGKPIGSGNYYKLWYKLPNGYFKAFKRFTGEHITLHPENRCRVITDQIDGF